MKPIVLAHGYLGFGNLGAIQYFNGVKQHLEEKWNAEVFASTVGPKDSVAARAADLEAEIRARFHGESVHIIAHSMGGLDARYLLFPKNGEPSDLVASLTTISTPHQGTFIAEIARGAVRPAQLLHSERLKRAIPKMVASVEEMWKGIKSSVLRRPKLVLPRTDVKSVLESLRSVLRSARHGDPGPLAVYLRKLFALKDNALFDLTPQGCAELFNDSLASPVPCFSYVGSAAPSQSLSPLLLLSYLLLKADEGDNDGLVSVASADWQTSLGKLPADHLGVIGWGSAASSDYLSWYDQMVVNIQQRACAANAAITL
uniref:Lipase LipAAc n=1 Tax=uncultured Acidobacteriota bacterium TaxID=171953 RepID=G8DPN2_9BACT|nr:lipase LipAAc [uncultured Acidobacteriota bacterium]